MERVGWVDEGKGEDGWVEGGEGREGDGWRVVILGISLFDCLF